MMKLQIELEDLKCLFIACKSKKGFLDFNEECEAGYKEYFERNNNDLLRYGTPKTYSQWVNGQIIYLT
jgi:hypothetical protein